MSDRSRGIETERAKRRVTAFARRFGKPHLDLAMHAAFPLFLTPDLLNDLWLNFQRDISYRVLNIPWIAIADLLLSDLCGEVGNELYEMNPAVRGILIDQLQADPRFGSARLTELGDFLNQYIAQQLNSDDEYVKEQAESQKWTATAYAQPERAAQDLASAVKQSIENNDVSEQLRLASVVETLAGPLQAYATLVEYTRQRRNVIGGSRPRLTVLGPDAETSPTLVAGVELPPLTLNAPPATLTPKGPPPKIPPYIFGIHGDGGEKELLDAGKPGWIAVNRTVENTGTPHDFSALESQGLGVIVTLLYSYREGTIPLPDQYDQFAAQCADLVRRSSGARMWVIGNEANRASVRPRDQAVTPELYARCFNKCRQAIRAVPGHENDWVLPAAVAPFSTETTYGGNPTGDWVKYFADLLKQIQAQGGGLDGITLHATTLRQDASAIADPARYPAPYDQNSQTFRAYRDFMRAIPEGLRALPVLITATRPIIDGKDRWLDQNTGWIQAAFAEINDWNADPINQPIQALCLARWQTTTDSPEGTLADKPQLLQDLRAALKNEYRVRMPGQAVPSPADTLGGETPMPKPQAQVEQKPEPLPETPATPRPGALTFEIENHDPNTPLQPGETYTLLCTANPLETDQIVAQIAPSKIQDREVELTLQLISDDVEIFTEPQRIRLASRGRARSVRFDFASKQPGDLVLTAFTLKDGNLVQTAKLLVNVRGPDKPPLQVVETRGRDLRVAETLEPRDMTVWIAWSDNRFKIVLFDDTRTESGTLPITPLELDQAIGEARTLLQQIVDFRNPSQGPDRAGIDIEPRVHQQTLRLVAQAGWNLFNRVFLDTALDERTRALVQHLRELSRTKQHKIQIVSQAMFLPWNLLYMADRVDPESVDPELFLGFRHIIEHTPFQPNLALFETSISGQPQLNVGLNLSTEIDSLTRSSTISDQISYWEKFREQGVQIVTRTDTGSVQNALLGPETPDQIMYFFCQAFTRPLSEGGPDTSGLQFNSRESIPLAFLIKPDSPQLLFPNAPFVFMNAAESPEMLPSFYAAYLPDFVDRGARGIIGSEWNVPAHFAADFAQKFFDQFLAGRPLGEILLDLRRDYLLNHNNILGLFYGLYCDAETHMAPPITGFGSAS